MLVTRPVEDGEETARALKARGHQALIAPLLTVKFLDGPAIALDEVQAILATSANGVRAFSRRSPRRDVPLFAVGPATANMARALGFQSVKSADGDADALALAASRWADPARGALLHVKGKGIESSLARNLPGFHVLEESLYVVEAVDKMPGAAAEALRQEKLDAALFFSPRSAAVFADCVRREKLPVGRLLAACISAAAAAALGPLQFRELRAAERPNQDSLLKLLDWHPH